MHFSMKYNWLHLLDMLQMVLQLARFADSIYLGGAPILKHHFRKEEYCDAKKRIQELVETKKQDSKERNGRGEK